MSRFDELARLIEQGAKKDSAPEKVYLKVPGEKLEKNKLELDALRVKNSKLEQTVKQAEETHELRKFYAKLVFGILAIWLIFVLAAVFMAGFKYKGFELPSEVLIAFITSSTVNVIGLFVIVAGWLYPKKSGDSSDSDETV